MGALIFKKYFQAVSRALVVLLVATAQLPAQTSAPALPYVLDMVFNNPGEERYVTKYNDPAYVKAQGFTGMVTHWYINCAITYDNVDKQIIPKQSAERKWIDAKANWIEKKLKECEAAGIDVYPFTDFIVFPQSIWEKYGSEITGTGKVEGTGGEDRRARKPDMQSKRTQELLRAQIAGIFDRFPQLDGLVLRFGETYLHDTPYHRGGGPIRAGESGIDDHVAMMNILREEVCVKRNRKLFYRTWDFGYNFHNNPDYYRKVTSQVQPHPNLILSIKYQQDDFHRMTPFNPTLGIGNHQQIVEAQSRMEAYGKGAHPYYSAIGVINGWPETKYQIRFGTHDFTGETNDLAAPRGIKDVLKNRLLAGVMTWSNGGGWQGPYIRHELWTDLNTYVVSRWAQNTSRTEEEMFYEFAARIGLTGYQADLFRQLNLLSVEGVRKGQLCSYSTNDVWWSRDEFFSAAANEKAIDELISNDKVKEALAEKAEASSIWLQIEALSKQLHVNDSATQRAMEVSSTYGRIKYQLIEQMWILMTQEGLRRAGKETDKPLIRNSLTRYDELWSEWKALEVSSEYCSTLYTDMAFRNERKGSIGELVDGLRRFVK